MRRFLVFAGEVYYARGGLCDIVGSFDTLDEAEEHFASSDTYEWWQIFDLETRSCVRKSEEQAYGAYGVIRYGGVV